MTNRTRSVRAVAQPEGGSCGQSGLVPPPRFTIVVMVGGRGYFSRHRFELLSLCAQLSLSSLLDPLTQQGKDGLGYFLVAGIIYPRSRV